MHVLDCIYTLNANLHAKGASYMIQSGQESTPCMSSLLLLLCCTTCGTAALMSLLLCLCCASECTVLPVDEEAEDYAAVF